jgi:3-hydroxyisobutyrate dehydrogenase-like beta-hydroxyacid dehydrogenase
MTDSGSDAAPEPSPARIGLLHPGAMGASLGAALVSRGVEVLWASAGRSPETVERARAAGLAPVDDVATLVAETDRLLSVCPPGAALEVARMVRDLGFRGIFIDANAISPETARRIESLFETVAVDFVDGGIVGPPARSSGTTRLHLSAARAAEVASWFAGTPVDAVVIEGPAGAASALKMVFAAWTKGTTALLAATYATARAEGVGEEILAEWARSVPDLPTRLARNVPASALKAWRFVEEMQEIAATFEAAGLPGGFHEAAADLYARLAGFKQAPEPPDLDEVMNQLRKP